MDTDEIRTKRSARRVYNAIISRCYRDASGGLSFGLDWPTLKILWPDRYEKLRYIESIFSNLKD